jgi:hypothetical protein
VRSSDRMMTLFFGVMGEFASLSGLKLKTLESIRFAIIGRRWMSMPRAFKVAVTSKASLFDCVSGILPCF